MEHFEFLRLGNVILGSMPAVWTFLLLLMRFGGLFWIMPGLGGGMSGMALRYPAMLIMAFSAMPNTPSAALPSDWILLAAQATAEFMFGFAIGLVPLALISGVQMAGYLSSTTMGLGAGNLIDPTLGMPSSDLSRIFGDLSIMLFLILGGQYAVIHAVSGFSGELPPGSFFVTDISFDLLLQAVADIFRVGVMISAPVVVALLLTQFVFGLVSRAVPTVNVFVVSFPLTIGVGLILSMLSIPELFKFLTHEFDTLDKRVGGVVESVMK